MQIERSNNVQVKQCVRICIGLLLMLSTSVMAMTPITIGVGGKALPYYLPLTVALQKGYFYAQGLDVTLQDFSGGGRALQAMMAGATEATVGAYEHTLRLQAQGRKVSAVILLGRSPGLALLARSEVGSVRALKGKRIGVLSLGSSSQFFASSLLARAGLSDTDVTFVAVGNGVSALAALGKGNIDAISTVEPLLSQALRREGIHSLVDTRQPDTSKAVYGGDMPAAVLYLPMSYIESHPETVQAMVNALSSALKWLQQASADDVVKLVPKSYWMNDKDLYRQVITAALPTYSPDGCLTLAGQNNAVKLLRSFVPLLVLTATTIQASFYPRFIQQVGLCHPEQN
jgi:NitT/TauT family transport system substrate-binding protein